MHLGHVRKSSEAIISGLCRIWKGMFIGSRLVQTEAEQPSPAIALPEGA